MTRRNIIALIAILVILGVGLMVYLQHRSVEQEAATPADYKAAFVDSCLKQANAAAMQQGASLNEEQKRMLQQICGCGAEHTATTFSPDEIAKFQANPSDPALLGRIKEIMQSCAAETKMPATNP